MGSKTVKKIIQGFYESNNKTPPLEADLKDLQHLYNIIDNEKTIEGKISLYHKWLKYLLEVDNPPMSVLKTSILISDNIGVKLTDYAFVWVDRQEVIIKYHNLKNNK